MSDIFNNIGNYFSAMGKLPQWYNGNCPTKEQIYGLTAAVGLVIFLGLVLAMKKSAAMGFGLVLIAILVFLFTGAGLYNSCSSSPAASPSQ